MPKVRFTRAGAVELEVDLEGRDLRIGRSGDNDLVLRDPDRTLSRHHAELRFDGGEWLYLDLNSANGSWVGGTQVTRQSLDRDITISLGDYELVFRRDGRRAEETAPDGDATRMIPVGDLQNLRGGPTAPGRGRDTAVLGSAVPAGQAGTNAPPAAVKAGWSPMRRALIFGWIAMFGVFAVMAAALFRPDRSADEPAAAQPALQGAPSPAAPVTSAPASGMDAEGATSSASQSAPVTGTATGTATAPAPATTASPSPAAAAVSVGAPVQPQPPPPASGAKPRTPVVQAPLPTASSAPSARAPASRAASGTTRPSEWVTAPPAPRRPARTDTEPETAGLPARPGETAAALRARRDRLRVQYDMGLQRLAARQYGEAKRILSEIADEAPGFRDVSARLAEADAGLQQQATQAFDTAARHEQAAEYAEALRAYEQLRPYAPSLPDLEAAITRTRARMHEAGIEALTRARQFDSRGRMPEAIAWYQRAVAWLPPEHPGLEAARQRLAQLGGRP